MKNIFRLQLAVLLLLGGLFVSCNRNKAQEAPQQEKIVLHSSPDLFELTREWAAVYCKLNPEVEIEVIQSNESAIMDQLGKTAQLGFVNGDLESEINDRSLWKITLGRDIIVPVISTRNPYLEEIRKQGISPSGLARILNNPANTSWGALIENGPDVPVVLYMSNDLSLHSEIAAFLETDREFFGRNIIREPEELAASLQSEPYALGICYLLDIMDSRKQGLSEHMAILPIDRNGNGYIDYKEDVYASLDALERGAWIGKYPAKLTKNIYTVSTSPPGNEGELAFLSWIINRGHVLLDNHRFGSLPEFERLAQAKIIDGLRDGRPAPGTFSPPKEPGFFTGPMPYILAVILLLSLLLYYNIRMRNRMQAGIPSRESIIPGLAFSEDHVEVSPGLYYDKTHTWAYMETDGTVKIGIDDFLQRVTGPLTRVKMLSPGEGVKKGKKAVSIIQEGKQLDICSPVSGTIKEFNARLFTDSSLLNSSPYMEGWIYKIEPANWFQEVQFMLLGNSYRRWLKKEVQRLKDFLSETFRTNTPDYVHVLQDGGEIRVHVLKDLGPEIWEDFQTNFLDLS